MGQRHSEYERIPGDFYATPAWVTDALLSVEKFTPEIYAPCVGEGHIIRALRDHGYVVCPGEGDFLNEWDVQDCDIVTNPPYGRLAEECVRHGHTDNG